MVIFSLRNLSLPVQAPIEHREAADLVAPKGDFRSITASLFLPRFSGCVRASHHPGEEPNTA